MRASFRLSDPIDPRLRCAAGTSEPRRIRAAMRAAPRSCEMAFVRQVVELDERPAAKVLHDQDLGRRRGTRSGVPTRAGRGARRTTSATGPACSRTRPPRRLPGTACRLLVPRRPCAGPRRADRVAASGSTSHRPGSPVRSTPRRSVPAVPSSRSCHAPRRPMTPWHGWVLGPRRLARRVRRLLRSP